jgi:hypothetical protein
MEIRRRRNRKPISDPLQCFLCLQEYDMYPEDAVAWSEGKRVGEVCPDCLQQTAHAIEMRLLEQAEQAEQMLDSGVVEVLYKEGDAINPRDMREGLHDMISTRRKYAAEGVRLLDFEEADQ